MKTMIAVPCMDMIHTPFVRSLVGMRLVGDAVEFCFSQNSLVYDSRNLLAEKAIREGFDRVLWLDSDMTFQPDLMARLADHLDSGKDYVSGFYTTRKQPITPCIVKSINLDAPEGPEARGYLDYPKDSLFEIAGSGFGAVMVTTSLLKKVLTSFGYPFSPILGLGEDFSFCCRVSMLGIKMYCDSSIKLGHVGFMEYNEETLNRKDFKKL